MQIQRLPTINLSFALFNNLKHTHTQTVERGASYHASLKKAWKDPPTEQ